MKILFSSLVFFNSCVLLAGMNIEKIEDSTSKQSENKDIVAGRLQNILNSLSKCKIVSTT